MPKFKFPKVKIHPLKTVGLVLIGGPHHVLHLIPIASELTKFKNTHVTIFVTTDMEKALCGDILTKLGLKTPDIRVLKAPLMLQRISPKLSFLLSNISLWNSLDAMIVAERTSTILRYVSRKLPPMIHIPHGAGDRAKSYDPRIRHFDNVLVAGEKDKARMISLGLVTEDNCDVTGYIKPYAVRQMVKDLPVLYETKRPIVLYNPHFSKSLSSWETYGRRLLDAFGQSAEFNFIFAPHMRLFKDAPDSLRKEIECYGEFENIHVDLGSEYSTDMTYTRLADIYLGDVSSQVYEFLSRPKPCVFVSAPDVQWENNPDYAHWAYGRVCRSAQSVMTALSAAHEEHEQYKVNQINGCLAAMGAPNVNPIKKAAQIVHALVHPDA